MDNRSIVFFTQLYYPDVTTTAVIMTELAEDLALYGLNVKVICAQPTYMNKQRYPKFEVRCRVSIRRVWTLLFNKNRILGRMLNGLSCFFSMFIKFFFAKKGDLFVFNTNPALLPILGLIGTKFKGQRYVILIHDLWPELPANIRMIKKNGLLYKLIDFINKLSLNNASRIIVLSNVMKDLILNKVPEKKNDIHVIHNWADVSRVFPVQRDHNKFIDMLNLRHKKVVMYSGNLGRYQPLEVMVKAANELKSRNDVQFIFIGDGGKKKKIQNLVSSMKLENVIFFPFQPHYRLAESLSMADVSLMGIYPQNEGVIMPSKLYGLLAVGKPIICVSDPCSEVVKILEESGAGFQSSIDNPQELAQKILAILDNPAKAQRMGLNGRKYLLKHFERKKLTKQWKEVLCETLFLIPSVPNNFRINGSNKNDMYFARENDSTLPIF